MILRVEMIDGSVHTVSAATVALACVAALALGDVFSVEVVD